MDKIVYLGMAVSSLSLLFERKNIRKTGNYISMTAMLFWVIVLMCANNSWGDAGAYNSYFNYVAINGQNPWDASYEFFTWCVLILERLTGTVNYGYIRALIFALCWIAIIITYRKYISNLYLVFFLYIISFMFAHDGVQIKNFWALTLVLIACSFLIEQKRHYLLKYYAVWFVAVLMHFSCAVYVLLPFINTKWYRKYKQLIPIVGGVMYIVIGFFGTRWLSNFLGIFADSVPMIYKLNKYLVLIPHIRCIVFVAEYIVIYIAMELMHSRKSFALNDSQYNQCHKFNQAAIDIWRLMAVFMPLLWYANAVFRIYRNLMILVFIFTANNITEYRRFSIRRIENSIWAFVIVFVVVFQLYALGGGHTSDFFTPIFGGEFFWNY